MAPGSVCPAQPMECCFNEGQSHYRTLKTTACSHLASEVGGSQGFLLLVGDEKRHRGRPEKQERGMSCRDLWEGACWPLL